MARSTFDNMAWHHDPLVRDIYSEIDDRSNEEIGEAIYEVYFGSEEEYEGDGESEWVDPTRSFQEAKATSRLTKKESGDATILASQIVDWANYGQAYGDYGNPPWERAGNPRESTQYPGRPHGWKPADPLIVKLPNWAPSPVEVSKGSPFYGGGYWTVMRQGGLTSGGFRTKALAKRWMKSPLFKKHYASQVNPKRGKKAKKRRKKNPKRISVRSLVAKALK